MKQMIYRQQVHPEERWPGLLLLAAIIAFLSLLIEGTLVTYAEEPAEPAQQEANVDPQANLPLDVTYARLRYRAPVYWTLDAVRANQPFSRLGGADFWVSLFESAQVGNQLFYRVRWSWNNFGWVSGDALQMASLSELHGIDLTAYPGQRLARVYFPKLNVRSQPGVLTPATLVGSLDAYQTVFILEEQWTGGALWYRIGDNEWIHSGFVREIKPSPRPEGVGPTDRWIEIDLTQQVLVAHEGDRPLLGTLVATGRDKFPTVTGLFRIWIKLRSAPMTGGSGNEAYALADVPWVMYFHQGYGLHGAYWHDNFGTVRSHGCVNLSAFDARWLFEFTLPVVPESEPFIRSTSDNPGTFVWVHY